MIAIGKTVLTPAVLADHLNPQADGTVTVSFADGSVLSVQPGGAQATRPAGTAGVYEKATVNGSVITYNPAGIPYQFSFSATVPNA